MKKIEDPRGTLVVLEGVASLPFTVRRSYFVYNLKNDAPRGFHAHRALEQVFVCARGSCEMRLDDGRQKTTIRLERPDQALYIGPMVWHEMHDFSDDCFFIVYASDIYDEADYIRNYEEFRRLSDHV